MKRSVPRAFTLQEREVARRPLSPAAVLSGFRKGFSTQRMAELLNKPESEIYNLLSKARLEDVAK